jgi:C4-dicarboxylate transporter DctM subunit
LRKVLTEVAALTGICGFLLAFAGVFSRFLTYSKAPIFVAEAIMPYVSHPAIFLGIVAIIWLFLGCVMNPVAAMTMTLPILFPVSQQFEIHPLHLAMVTTVALAIGHVTPPVGISLFIGSSIAKMGIEEVVPMLVPFILVMILVVIVLILVPGFSLWLPSFFGYA